MLFVAHRGCMNHYPENSEKAVRFVSGHVDRIELDVRACLSGELVVFRDEHTARVTDLEGTVSKLRYEELQELTIGDSGESIPLLSDILEAVHSDTGLHIELRHSEIIPDVLAEVAQYTHDVTYISGDLDILRAVKEHDDTADTGYVFYETDEVEQRVTDAAQAGCHLIETHFANVIQTDVLTMCDSHDIKVIVGGGGADPHICGISDILLRQKLDSIGIDGIMVDTVPL